MFSRCSGPLSVAACFLESLFFSSCCRSAVDGWRGGLAAGRTAAQPCGDGSPACPGTGGTEQGKQGNRRGATSVLRPPSESSLYVCGRAPPPTLREFIQESAPPKTELRGQHRGVFFVRNTNLCFHRPPLSVCRALYEALSGWTPLGPPPPLLTWHLAAAGRSGVLSWHGRSRPPWAGCGRRVSGSWRCGSGGRRRRCCRQGWPWLYGGGGGTCSLAPSNQPCLMTHPPDFCWRGRGGREGSDPWPRHPAGHGRLAGVPRRGVIWGSFLSGWGHVAGFGSPRVHHRGNRLVPRQQDCPPSPPAFLKRSLPALFSDPGQGVRRGRNPPSILFVSAAGAGAV